MELFSGFFCRIKARLRKIKGTHLVTLDYDLQNKCHVVEKNNTCNSKLILVGIN